MMKIIKWLDNFWYHYKWVTIIGVFFTVAVIIMTAQYINRDRYDAMILYTGPRIPDANQTLEIKHAFENVLQEDYDGNSKREVAINTLFLMTDEQLKDKRYYTDQNGTPLLINTQEMVNTKQQFTTQIFVGEALICLLDPAWYEHVAKEDAFVPLSELVDEVPENAYDECALYLRDTGFGQYYTALEALPEDTLICFRQMPSPSSFKSEKKEIARYEFNKRFFIDLIEFE
ncbi:MAG: hypothetical protein IKT46_03770 [Clostridia bacterium]|nr:hypothetical protein [Clostridia bacterium]